ncbi:hypothetical protein N7513_007248 [Penicillium frequentans]|nr:hypothetical protein N7513_007248 [Penicillium glabrum]
MDHQVLDLRIANCPVKNVTMITPPAESELNLDRRDKGLDYEPVATDLSRIYRLTPNPTLVLDGTLQVLEVSNSHVATFHRSRDSLLGTNVYELPLPSVALSTREVQTIKSLHVERCDARFALNVTPIFEDNILIYVILEAEQTKHDRNGANGMSKQTYLNETYKILVNTIRDYVIYMLDTRGHIATWNSGAVILMGYTATEIVGQHFSVFYGRDGCAIKKPARVLEICLREGKVEDEGWRYRKNGTRFWANVIVTAIYQNGSHLGFVKVTRDLTERRAAEARLIDAFEESAKLKSDFLAHMSHELRTPMNGMSLALTMLMRTELNEDQREYASILEDSTSILLQIINDVLDYSKLSSGSFSLNADVLNVPNVINAVVRNFQPALKAGVELKSAISPGFPPDVKGDPLRFRQVIQNLVSNAVKFTDKGCVHIDVTYTVDENDSDRYLITTKVIDSGIGVSDTAVNTLFTPFARFADTATKRHQGTGLGLSICKSLAEFMDGAVGYHANPVGLGSVFWMTAKMARISPVSQVKQRPPLIKAPPLDYSEALKKIASQKHILLVEDNRVNQTIMIKLLSTLGFECVDTAWDGAEAVRLVKLKPLTYSVILMDINMPIMDGLTATERIRKMKLDVPIIALTGNALKGDAEIYMAKGMNDYIAKPLHRHQLVDMLWKWCGS